MSSVQGPHKMNLWTDCLKPYSQRKPFYIMMISKAVIKQKFLLYSYYILKVNKGKFTLGRIL